MFFMMGITDGRKDLDFVQTVICGVCGKYGRYQVFMTYTVLSLFLFHVLSGTGRNTSGAFEEDSAGQVWWSIQTLQSLRI